MSKLAWYVAIMFAIDMAIYLIRFIVVVARGSRTESCDRTVTEERVEPEQKTENGASEAEAE